MRLEIAGCIVFVLISVVAANVWRDRLAEREQALQDAAATQQEGREKRKSKTQYKTTTASYYSQEVRIPASNNRQFYVDAKVNFQRTRFLVDTGASYVTLRESDAARVGLRPGASDYKHTVSTANGKTRAAFVVIKDLEIDNVSARDVDAFILPDQSLSISLLGMSFLSKINSVETKNGEMILKG